MVIDDQIVYTVAGCHFRHCKVSRISSRETPLCLETERKIALRVPIRKLSCAGMEIRRSGCIKKESIDGFPHIVAQLVPGVCLCINTFRKTFGDKAPISFLCDLEHQFSHSTPLPCMVMKCTCRDTGSNQPSYWTAPACNLSPSAAMTLKMVLKSGLRSPERAL